MGFWVKHHVSRTGSPGFVVCWTSENRRSSLCCWFPSVRLSGFVVLWLRSEICLKTESISQSYSKFKKYSSSFRLKLLLSEKKRAVKPDFLYWHRKASRKIRFCAKHNFAVVLPTALTSLPRVVAFKPSWSKYLELHCGAFSASRWDLAPYSRCKLWFYWFGKVPAGMKWTIKLHGPILR